MTENKDIPQFVACGLKMGNCGYQIPYDMAEHERIIRADVIDEYKQELKQDINSRLKSVEKYLEGETLDAWRQATRTFKDAIDYFAKQVKEQNNDT